MNSTQMDLYVTPSEPYFPWNQIDIMSWWLTWVYIWMTLETATSTDQYYFELQLVYLSFRRFSFSVGGVKSDRRSAESIKFMATTAQTTDDEL